MQQNPQGEFVYHNKETSVGISIPRIVGLKREMLTIAPGSKLAEQVPALAKESWVELPFNLTRPYPFAILKEYAPIFVSRFSIIARCWVWLGGCFSCQSIFNRQR